MLRPHYGGVNQQMRGLTVADCEDSFAPVSLRI